MNQSNLIFGAIFVAYVIYIVMKGEFGIYLGLLLNTQSVPVTGAASGGGTQGAAAAQTQNVGGQVVQFAGAGAANAATLVGIF